MGRPPGVARRAQPFRSDQGRHIEIRRPGEQHYLPALPTGRSVATHGAGHHSDVQRLADRRAADCRRTALRRAGRCDHGSTRAKGMGFGEVKLPASEGVHILVPHGHKLLSSEFVTIERTHRMPRAVNRAGIVLAPLVRAVLDARPAHKSRRPGGQAADRGRSARCLLPAGTVLRTGKRHATRHRDSASKFWLRSQIFALLPNPMLAGSAGNSLCHRLIGTLNCATKVDATSPGPTHGGTTSV
jgi:hypothetical protein